jgi:hypothetical protein
VSSDSAIAPAAGNRIPWGVWLAAQAAVVLLLATGPAILVHSACVAPGPPVSRPEPGTPRAGYCDAVGGSTLWLLLVAAPVGVLLCAAPLVRRRPGRGWAVAAVIVTVLWANSIYVGTLDFAYTV